MRSILGLFSVLLLAAAAVSCSSTGSTTKNTKTEPSVQAPSIYPDWYNRQDDFAADSLEFSGYATAIAADSVQSVRLAERLARVHLEKGIDAALESIRVKTVKKQGQQSAYNKASNIRALRNAAEPLQGMAKVEHVKTLKQASHYRSFVQVRLQKQQAKSTVVKSLPASVKDLADSL